MLLACGAPGFGIVKAWRCTKTSMGHAIRRVPEAATVEAPNTEGTTSVNDDRRQVFWLTGHPTNHAFSADQHAA